MRKWPWIGKDKLEIGDKLAFRRPGPGALNDDKGYSATPAPNAKSIFLLPISLYRFAMRSASGRLNSVVFCVITSLVIYAIYLCLSWASLGVDQQRLEFHARQAFADGELLKMDKAHYNILFGAHQFNDCLIIDQALSRYGTPLQRTVTPSNDFPDRHLETCPQLRQSLNRAGAPGPGSFYHNYVHGHTVLARALLSIAPLRVVREGNRLAITLVLLAGCYLCCRNMLTRGASAENLFWLVFFITFARWFGLELLAPSLGHAPSDFVFFAYGLTLAAMSFRRCADQRAYVLAATIFGTLTAIFEFLTGGIPLGLALTIGGVAVAMPDDDRVAESAIGAGIAFVLAIATVAMAKIASVLTVFGSGALGPSAGDLLHRLSASVQGPEAPPITFAAIMERLIDGLETMTPGLWLLSFGAICFGVVLGAFALGKMWQGEKRLRAMLIAGSNGVLVLWVVVFWQHFYVHAWFMLRIFAWTIASGAGLFAMALRDGGSRRGLAKTQDSAA